MPGCKVVVATTVHAETKNRASNLRVAEECTAWDGAAVAEKVDKHSLQCQQQQRNPCILDDDQANCMVGNQKQQLQGLLAETDDNAPPTSCKFSNNEKS